MITFRTQEQFKTIEEVEEFVSMIFDYHRDVAIASGLDEFQAQRLAEKSFDDCLHRLDSQGDIPTQEQCQIVANEVAKIWF